MNLTAMMAAAGIGCGEGCRCAKLFTATLDDTQKAIFTHMIENGAKKRLKKIKKAGKLDDKSGERQNSPRGPSLGGFFDQMFEDAFSPNRQEPLSPFATMMRAMMREELTEPYTGDLTADQIKVLAETNEDVRARVEEELRKLIAQKVNNDPSRVSISSADDGADVLYRVLPDPESEMQSEPGDFMAALLSALREGQRRRGVEPYTGDLTANQLEILATLDEEERSRAEENVRWAIAEHGGNDARRVQLRLTKNEMGRLISAIIIPPIDEAGNGESTEKTDQAA